MESNVDGELIDILLDFGETMLDSGAEIARVEDSLTRMGNSFGAIKTHAFVINSSIELTVLFEDGETITRTRRIRSNGSTDFEKLRLLNSLSRQCVKQRMPVEELRTEVDAIKCKQIPPWKTYLGSFLAASSFCVFFGGSYLDALLSGAVALFICLLQFRFSPLTPNKVFFCLSLPC